MQGAEAAASIEAGDAPPAGHRSFDQAPIDNQPQFFNRELSWLSFNERVLAQAEDLRHPLLERLRYVSISASNLDEFYMVRVAGLKGMVAAGIDVEGNDGRTPVATLKEIAERAGRLMREQQRIWREIGGLLAREGIEVLRLEQLDGADRAWLDAYFMTQIFPVLTPIAVDPAHPFPFIHNTGMGLLAELDRGERDDDIGLILMPAQLGRFVRLPGKTARFLLMEDVVEAHLDRLFPGVTVRATGLFRVLRDSDLEIEDEAEDLVRMFESALKRRRRGHVIRLTVEAGMPETMRDFLIEQIKVERADVVELEHSLGLVDVKQLIGRDRPDLAFAPYAARFPERIRDFGGDCFAAIKAKDFVVHHPFESFDVVVQFLKQAARDKAVLAIKQTLYRTSEDSPIIAALIAAAEAGKSVTAMVELKARFDEERNIRWARNLERAGVQVVYGFLELKTHAKISLVVRKEAEGVRSYAHFGTGNYHPITARIYTDLSFFTCDPALCRDAAKTFNYMTGYATPVELERVAIAPMDLRARLIQKIEAEAAYAQAGRKGQIWGKMNSLVDEDVIRALYGASAAGVEIDLVVRGICCLRPGVPGLSERIRVKSIVGRFLEHSRIVCFGAGHGLPSPKAEIYVSSADWMSRNLSRRVELLAPIDNPTVHRQVMGEIMVANLKDEANSWLLAADGTYAPAAGGEDGEPFDCHTYFMTNPSLSGRGSALNR